MQEGREAAAEPSTQRVDRCLCGAKQNALGPFALNLETRVPPLEFLLVGNHIFVVEI